MPSDSALARSGECGRMSRPTTIVSSSFTCWLAAMLLPAALEELRRRVPDLPGRFFVERVRVGGADVVGFEDLLDHRRNFPAKVGLSRRRRRTGGESTGCEFDAATRPNHRPRLWLSDYEGAVGSFCAVGASAARIGNFGEFWGIAGHRTFAQLHAPAEYPPTFTHQSLAYSPVNEHRRPHRAP